jgi:hypothetical protein
MCCSPRERRIENVLSLYVGKGLGDMPIGALRVLAITGEQSYGVPDHRLNSGARP